MFNINKLHKSKSDISKLVLDVKASAGLGGKVNEVARGQWGGQKAPDERRGRQLEDDKVAHLQWGERKAEESGGLRLLRKLMQRPGSWAGRSCDVNTLMAERRPKTRPDRRKDINIWNDCILYQTGLTYFSKKVNASLRCCRDREKTVRSIRHDQ